MINDRNKTNMALENIFAQLEQLIATASRVPIVDKLIVEENELVNLLDDLREAIPKEVKDAVNIIEEQRKIINQAYADAENIVQQAKGEADRILNTARSQADEMVRQENIVQEAEAMAQDIRANADAYEEETKKAADDYAFRAKNDALTYADDMLAYIGDTLHSALQGLNDNRQNVSKELDVLAGGSQENIPGLEEPR